MTEIHSLTFMLLTTVFL